MALRAERVSTPEFPIPPRDATEEQRRWYREFQNIFERYVLNAQLPPHTKGADQFLRHDATSEKLTWQSIGTIVHAGLAGLGTGIGEVTVHTTLVKATTVILLTPQDVGADTGVTCEVKSRIVGRNFTIKCQSISVPRYIGYALFESSILALAGSDGTCPLVKTGVVHGSGSFVDGTTITFTWDPTTSHWTTGGVWDLYDDGTQWFIQTPAVDKFAVSDSAACPPNGIYTQVGTGNPGATITLS